MEWHPIETAPKDGTRILLYRPLAVRTNDYPIDIMRGVPRDNTCWEETIPPGMDATNYTDGACKATHWMPLPEAPNAGGNAPERSEGRVDHNVRCDHGEKTMIEDDVKWIVNDLGELGVEVNGRCFFLYKGESLEYGRHAETKDGVCLHDDGTPMLYRMVGKREFGEVQWPQKWVIAGRREDRYTEKLALYAGLSFGKPEDGDWKPLPAPNA